MLPHTALLYMLHPTGSGHPIGSQGETQRGQHNTLFKLTKILICRHVSRGSWGRQREQAVGTRAAANVTATAADCAAAVLRKLASALSALQVPTAPAPVSHSSICSHEDNNSTKSNERAMKEHCK
jgi:hypothetical protein